MRMKKEEDPELGLIYFWPTQPFSVDGIEYTPPGTFGVTLGGQVMSPMIKLIPAGRLNSDSEIPVPHLLTRGAAQRIVVVYQEQPPKI